MSGRVLAAGAAVALLLGTAPADADERVRGRWRNQATVSQTGSGHGSAIVQTGSGNTATIVQRGRGNSGAISQTGANNAACLIQIGRGIEGSIVQNGDGQSTGLLQTRWGERAIPVEACHAGVAPGAYLGPRMRANMARKERAPPAIE